MTALLDVNNVSFSYGNGPIVLFETDLAVEEGQIVGLVGPNGSGKSTLINLIFDNYQLKQGHIRLSGYKHHELDGKKTAIYLPSEDFLPDFLTGLEYYRAVERMYGTPAASAGDVSSAFQALGMAGREEHLIEDYSHGMKKKVQFLTAFLLDRPLTVIDETFNGIDLDAQRYCMRRLGEMRDRGRGVLLCTHDFPLLEEVADEVVVMKNALVLDRVSIKELRTEGTTLKSRVDEMLFGSEHESV
ncbi:ATP-binding cassette domain-containing protein [Arthrobacter sp. AD-310]